MVRYMDAEAILDIVLASLLGAMHALALAICIIWRVKKYRKGLHYAVAGFVFLGLSVCIGVALPIGGFTFLNGGTSGTKALISGMVFCPIILPFAIRAACYCIYIDGHEVVKSTLFSEIRIDLEDPGTYIYDRDQPFSLNPWIYIYSSDDKVIEIDSRRIEGKLTLFLDDCKKIQKTADH